MYFGTSSITNTTLMKLDMCMLYLNHHQENRQFLQRQCFTKERTTFVKWNFPDFWFVNSNSLFLRFWESSISSILKSKQLYETLPSNSFYYYFSFSECPLFCLSNFLCIVRITCHGALFIFLHNRPSHWWSIR